ncbi:MAG: hypothetical protein Q4E73_05225 [Lachnospiraceae bacterium]|nr:hypothetical protein [Lachnospiraceae bacterium]
MSTKLVEDENTVFEIDEDCLKEKSEQICSEKTVEITDMLVNIQESPEKDSKSEFSMQSCERKKNHSNLWLIALLICLCKR